MSVEDPIIARVREARMRISEELDHDPSRLREYCEKLDALWRQRMAPQGAEKTAPDERTGPS